MIVDISILHGTNQFVHHHLFQSLSYVLLLVSHFHYTVCRLLFTSMELCVR